MLGKAANDEEQSANDGGRPGEVEKWNGHGLSVTKNSSNSIRETDYPEFVLK